MRASGGQPGRHAAAGAALLVLLAIGLLPAIALAGTSQIVPDSACETANQFKSENGDVTAALTVINNSDETVQTFWRNYEGERVLYERLAPHTSYVQETWLTHPWVVASESGECYRFVVMNAREQTVTVAPANPDPAATVVAVPSRTPPVNAPTAGPTVGPATTSGPVGTETSDTTSDYTWLLILGVLASMAAVLIGASVATGRAPWMHRGGRPPRP